MDAERRANVAFWIKATLTTLFVIVAGIAVWSDCSGEPEREPTERIDCNLVPSACAPS